MRELLFHHWGLRNRKRYLSDVRLAFCSFWATKTAFGDFFKRRCQPSQDINARTDAQIRIFKQQPTFSLFIYPGNVILFEKPYETRASCFIIVSKRLETKFTFSCLKWLLKVLITLRETQSKSSPNFMTIRITFKPARS